MKKTVFILIGALAVAVHATPVTARGSGRNADYRAAVYDALAQAMSQVEGLSLQESRESLMSALEQTRSSTLSGDVAVSDMREALKQSISAKTAGQVLGYDILSERFEPETGTWHVEVEARLPGRYVVGRDPDNLRRMVVVPFRSLTSKVTLCGEEVDCARGNETIADSLNTYLTQTRKFTMLDRQFSAETAAELSRLSMANASSGDRVRIGQLLVTDYLVAGTVKFYSQLPAVSNPYTVGGSVMPDSTCAEVSYRVLLAPTSQLKWSDTVKIPYSMCTGSNASEILASALECAAEEICEQIISNIYPACITDKTASELVINQGGRSIRVGDEFDVFRNGGEMFDVTTGESLGFREEYVTRIRVVRVTPKASYAVALDGATIDTIEIGAIVRRPSYVDAGYMAPANAVRPIDVGPGGGVSAPWAQ